MTSSRSFVYGLLPDDRRPWQQDRTFEPLYDPYWDFPHKEGEPFDHRALRPLPGILKQDDIVEQTSTATVMVRLGWSFEGLDDVDEFIYEFNGAPEDNLVLKYYNAVAKNGLVPMQGKTAQRIAFDLTSLHPGNYEARVRFSEPQRSPRNPYIKRFGVRRQDIYEHWYQGVIIIPTTTIALVGIFAPAGAEPSEFVPQLGDGINIYVANDEMADKWRASFYDNKIQYGLYDTVMRPKASFIEQLKARAVKKAAVSLAKHTATGLYKVYGVVAELIDVFGKKKWFEKKWTLVNTGAPFDGSLGSTVFLAYSWELKAFGWNNDSYIEKPSVIIVALVPWFGKDERGPLYEEPIWQTLSDEDDLMTDVDLSVLTGGFARDMYGKPPRPSGAFPPEHHHIIGVDGGVGLTFPRLERYHVKSSVAARFDSLPRDAR